MEACPQVTKHKDTEVVSIAALPSDYKHRVLSHSLKVKIRVGLTGFSASVFGKLQGVNSAGKF